MIDLPEAGVVTGTADRDYNLLRFIQTCLSNALRYETFIEDARRAGDDEVARLLTEAQACAVRGAEEGKHLLASRMGG